MKTFHSTRKALRHLFCRAAFTVITHLLPNNFDVCKSAVESGKFDAWSRRKVAVGRPGCRKRGDSQSSQRSHVEGSGGSPSKQLFLSPPREPPPRLPFLWDVLDMLLMSVGSWVFCFFSYRAA